MDMAVGRLQFSVRMADTRTPRTEKRLQPQADPVEAAFRRERTFQDVTADRERWANDTMHRGGKIY